jgi:Tfp pilus tip-associated adhesin PilY1
LFLNTPAELPPVPPPDADASGWKTILAGGLNAGGQGIYALDISDPSTFTEGSDSNN